MKDDKVIFAYRYNWLLPFLILLALSAPIHGAAKGSPVAGESAGGRSDATGMLMADIQALSAIGDRSTGTEGCEKAAAYVRSRMESLEFGEVKSHTFALPVNMHESSTIAFSDRTGTAAIYPLRANAITPGATPPGGITGPLIYAGHGTYREFNGKTVAGSVVLMEFDSGKNWLNAASLGARALIFIDRGHMGRVLFDEKKELTPIDFPLFWMPVTQARSLFGDFESSARMEIHPGVTLTSRQRWEKRQAENLYLMIPGTDEKLGEELVLVESFYDSSVFVPGRSPGADEALGIATLLALGRHLKHHPPARSVMLVATSGHGQTLAGMRELVWSVRTRSRDMRQLKKQHRERVKQHKKIVGTLKKIKLSDPESLNGMDDEEKKIVKAVMTDQIKTVVDRMSRELMALRLGKDAEKEKARIDALARHRFRLRQLGWRTDYDNLSSEEAAEFENLLRPALARSRRVHEDVKQEQKWFKSASAFRSAAKSKELTAFVSLHLSSSGDGLGAFNKGWLYPLKAQINRVSAYTVLDDVLRNGAEASEAPGLYRDTLRPSRRRSWDTWLVDKPWLGGEISAIAGYHGISLVTVNDARNRWGTPYDTAQEVNIDFALQQSRLVAGLVDAVCTAPKLHLDEYPRNGFSVVKARTKFMRHGELFADQPAPDTMMLSYQGQAYYHNMTNTLGEFEIRGVSDKKHVLGKVIIEGYKFDPDTGLVTIAIDKPKTGKDAYRVKMQRRYMETDLIMFACKKTTIFNLLEPRSFRYMTKIQLLDGRREAAPIRFWYSRIDTWSSIICSIYLEPGTPLKLTLSDSVIRKKLILTNADEEHANGTGYRIDDWPFLHNTPFLVARDMWALLLPRIRNLENRGIFDEKIRNLQVTGTTALSDANEALAAKEYDRFMDQASRSWALATRVYDHVEQTQKDVLFGVLFYIALFVPFAFCMERFLFSYTNIYKRLIAFFSILFVVILVIYQVHPAFELAYSPTVVILAFFIIGLSLMVSLIIFFRFEEEMIKLQSRAKQADAGEISKWKAFVSAFFLGVSNLRRRRIRTVLTCATLVILTFTIMSFTSVKTSRHHARIMYQPTAPYQGYLLKNVNWRDLPPESLSILSGAFSSEGTIVPRVWMEAEDKTRTTRIPLRRGDRTFEALGVVGLSPEEADVTELDKILVSGRWLEDSERRAVLLPDRMAQILGIDPAHPAGATVDIWGIPFNVVGVFSGKRLQETADLDGEPVTPVTFPKEVSTEVTEVEMDALESGDDIRAFQSRYQHVAGDLTIIIPARTLLAAGGHLKSVAIRSFDSGRVKENARNLVDRFNLTLYSGEKDGIFLYNASDTLSYSGVPNIVIPLVISIFIVLNTMIGSVYERKNEIGIYTSVGLAPSHVSFLFIAEAMAFAVISVVLGYLFAQTSAKIFSGTSLWAGITVNYSSMAGVAAMGLVILVVLVSVIYPSKVAAEIAIPDVNRSWSLPKTDKSEIEVTLPFLMKYREHQSVGGYLLDYFRAHQDISHGLFSTGGINYGHVCSIAPKTAEDEKDCPNGQCNRIDLPCLQLSARVWLAPFDFGIMQTVYVDFCHSDEDPGFLLIKVRLERQSGEANNWRRINKAFLHTIRKQLLIWRSFSDRVKDEYAAVIPGGCEIT